MQPLIGWLALGLLLMPLPVLTEPAATGALAVGEHDAVVQLLAAARERTQQRVRYDGSYQRIEYPMGDVPADRGVCTDVIVRSYRAGLGIDLQQLVHEDMRAHFALYPPLWGLHTTDKNIDHRRVPNLQTFFERHGISLPVPAHYHDFNPGDIVTWSLPGNLPHIGIVSERRTADGARPLIIHNVGAGPKEEDALGVGKITGRYRFLPPLTDAVQ